VFGSFDNLVWATFIDLSHTLNFFKFEIVSFLIDMSLIFMSGNCGLCSFLDHDNNEVFGLFTISVSNHVCISIVNESITPRPECLRRNVSATAISAKGVQHFLIENFLIDDHFSLADDMQALRFDKFNESSLITHNLNLDVRVEFS
jgi:hypothetical protein